MCAYSLTHVYINKKASVFFKTNWAWRFVLVMREKHLGGWGRSVVSSRARRVRGWDRERAVEHKYMKCVVGSTIRNGFIACGAESLKIVFTSVPWTLSYKNLFSKNSYQFCDKGNSIRGSKILRDCVHYRSKSVTLHNAEEPNLIGRRHPFKMLPLGIRGYERTGCPLSLLP